MPTFTLPIQYLNTLQRIGKASDRDKTSPMLSGIRIYISGKKIETASTDGKILAQHIGDIANPDNHECDIVIPWANDKPLQSWVKANAKGRGELIVLIENGQVTFQANGETTVRKKIQGTYPNYRGALVETMEYTHAFQGDYLATVGDILCDKFNKCVKIRQGRGWTFESLKNNENMRVLVMPVIMPDQKKWIQVEASEYAKMLQDLAEYNKIKGCTVAGAGEA